MKENRPNGLSQVSQPQSNSPGLELGSPCSAIFLPTANTLSFLVLVGEASDKGCLSLYFLMMSMAQDTKVTRWERVQLSCPQSTSETEAADPRTVAIR